MIVSRTLPHITLLSFSGSPKYLASNPDTQNIPVMLRQPTITCDNTSPPHNFYHHRLTPPGAGESERAGMRTASGDSIRTQGVPICSRPLPEPITVGTGACNNHLPPNAAPRKLSPKASPLTNIRCLNETLHGRRPGERKRPIDALGPDILTLLLEN